MLLCGLELGIQYKQDLAVNHYEVVSWEQFRVHLKFRAVQTTAISRFYSNPSPMELMGKLSLEFQCSESPGQTGVCMAQWVCLSLIRNESDIRLFNQKLYVEVSRGR